MVTRTYPSLEGEFLQGEFRANQEAEIPGPDRDITVLECPCG